MIMAKIIKRADSLTEPPLTTASRRSLPPRGSLNIRKNFNLSSLGATRHSPRRGKQDTPLTTALTGGASPRGEAAKRLTIFAGKNEVR